MWWIIGVTVLAVIAAVVVAVVEGNRMIREEKESKQS